MPENTDKQDSAQVVRKYLTRSVAETQALAGCMARKLRRGDFVALVGDLGAGKTTFVQGLAQGLCVAGRVSSPTFVLMHCHSGPLPLCHLDAYRVGSGEELHQAGAQEYLENAVVVVEWADRVPDFWPPEALVVSMAYAEEEATVQDGALLPAATAEGVRSIMIQGRGERLAGIVRELDIDDSSS